MVCALSLIISSFTTIWYLKYTVNQEMTRSIQLMQENKCFVFLETLEDDAEAVVYLAYDIRKL